MEPKEVKLANIFAHRGEGAGGRTHFNELLEQAQRLQERLRSEYDSTTQELQLKVAALRDENVWLHSRLASGEANDTICMLPCADAAAATVPSSIVAANVAGASSSTVAAAMASVSATAWAATTATTAAATEVTSAALGAAAAHARPCQQQQHPAAESVMLAGDGGGPSLLTAVVEAAGGSAPPNSSAPLWLHQARSHGVAPALAGSARVAQALQSGCRVAPALGKADMPVVDLASVVPHVCQEPGAAVQDGEFSDSASSFAACTPDADDDAAEKPDAETGLHSKGSQRLLPYSVLAAHSSAMAKTMALKRLRARLGIDPGGGNLTGEMLWKTSVEAGLSKFEVKDLEALVRHMSRLRTISDHKDLSCIADFCGYVTQCVTGIISQASLRPQRRSQLSDRMGCSEGPEDDVPVPEMSLQEFVDFLYNDRLVKRLKPTYQYMLNCVAEILVSGDTNRMVAELTNTKIEDLASPPPKMELLTAIEPVVSFVIITNGILVGLQCDPTFENWPGWFYVEAFFVMFFLLELFLRVFINGVKRHFFGSEAVWNHFDVAIIILAIADLIAQGLQSSMVLRLMRLIRLSRLLRMFRFQMLRELVLMLKGLLGGFRTLCWAIVLLLSSIYVISVFMVSTIGNTPAVQDVVEDAEEFFSTVPRCMFTAFRCLLSDCSDLQGRSLVSLLAREYGYMFTVPYVLCTVLIVFGIFNLIIALYIEATLNAAKHQDEGGKYRVERENLRVAHTVKKLVNKFQQANKLYAFRGSAATFSTASDPDSADEIGDLAWTITKDLFLLVIQDQQVQALMDDLDIPPERTHLFDVLDADGSGGLQVREMVQGLMKVRGEARKSDMVACLLAIRAALDMLRDVSSSIQALDTEVKSLQKC